MNIVLLIADSLRYDSVFSKENSDLIPQKLSQESHIYRNTYSSGCWTLPATSSIFTGKLPHEHQATTRTRMGLNNDYPTLAEILSSKGYETVQLTANPVTTHIFGLDRGFDRIERSWNYFEKGEDTFLNSILLLGKRRIRQRFLQGDFITGKMTEDIKAGQAWVTSFAPNQMDRAINLIEQNQKENTPSFLFLNLMETHFPYHIDETFKTLSSGIFNSINELKSLYHMVNQSWLKTGKRHIHPSMLEVMRKRQQLAWKNIKDKVDLFYKRIKENFPNTLFIFGADHGDNFGDEGWRYHFSNLTEAGNRIPLFIHSPAEKNENREIFYPVSNRRLFDYILNFATEKYTPLHKIKRTAPPVLQSFWYDMHGQTKPKYQHDQFGFVNNSRRYLKKGKEWEKYEIKKSLSKFPEKEKIKGNPIYDLDLVPEFRNNLESRYKQFKQFSNAIS